METIMIVYVIILLILLWGSAFFSSSETVLSSVNDLRMRQQALDGDKRSGRVVDLLNQSQRALSALLIGNNIANIGASALATVLFTYLLGHHGPLVATVVMTLVVLIFCEIIPKSMARAHPERLSLSIAGPVQFFMFIFYPFVVVLEWIADKFISLIFPETTQEPSITEDELKSLVDVGAQEGVFQKTETKYIHNVIDFGEATAMDIMKPRTSMVTLDVDISERELNLFLEENTYSRVPVYEDNIDNIIGMLYMKDIVYDMALNKKIDVRKYLRDPFFISESATAEKVFKDLKKRNLSLAIVVDEYAGTSGILTIEDILEELFGRIDDEYDLDENELLALDSRTFLLNPEIRIDKINELFRLHLVSKYSDSIGGLMMEWADRIPEIGDEESNDQIKLTLMEKSGQKLTQIKLEVLNRQSRV